MQEPTDNKRTCRTLSIVVPVFNEQEVLPLLWERLGPIVGNLDAETRFLFVDDGSTDGSLEFLLRLAEDDPRVGVLSFSRNFGNQAAVTAGLEWASGDAVVVMDADLQDPPELIPEMISRYEEGYDVVYACRRKRRGESAFKKLSASLFRRAMGLAVGSEFAVNAGIYRLISEQAVRSLNAMPECHRFIPAMVTWVGFNQTAVMFDRRERAAGTSKFGLLRMLRLAWSAMCSFSTLPIRSGMAVGTVLLLLSFLYSFRVFYVRFVTGTAVPGWTTIVLLQLAFFGLVFFYMGIMGEYVGRIYEEGKRRPLYVLKLIRNAESAGARPAVKPDQTASTAQSSPREAGR